MMFCLFFVFYQKSVFHSFPNLFVHKTLTAEEAELVVDLGVCSVLPVPTPHSYVKGY